MNTLNTPLIDTRRLSYRLDGTVLLRDVSFELHSGELVGLIGPNGAGKSTLLRTLGGLLADSQGEIRLIGRSIKELSTREVARMVAHVPQSTVIDFAFTVREVVLMGRSPHLGRFQIEGAEDRRVADEAMRAMQIDDLADRFVNTLSGGERQRVFVARALAQQPRVLLLDEPTANLDVRHEVDLLRMVARLAREDRLGIIAAIHDLDLAAHFCDRLILLHEGCVMADALPEAVLTPHNLAETFRVQARTFRDPFTDALRLSLLDSGEDNPLDLGTARLGSNGYQAHPSEELV